MSGRKRLAVIEGEDAAPEAMRPTVALAGDDNLVFNTDYPHPDGTFPWGIERLGAQPIADSSKRKILWDNAARAFHLEA